ncbi:MAG: AMP-binding protein [Candidatus Dadabacteria bacterium]|nr:AMP-binding protein [Candidatus Dadabacteria bacterium]NIS07750.1 AMP-binding protein [Candidatus Dadabacteria bacterium]NIV40989.1 AMP-binding protein [Candidatus Dadabacteria bacterium]NIX14402.1 AMP-binding protein [Candidatus Dadabacteria bacterium]NIY20914.1 AMP-binding protein [Candidatus Dadabacteria bacterium]
MKKYTVPNKKIPVIRDSYGYKTISEMVEKSADKYGSKTAYEIPRNGKIIKYSFSDVIDLVQKLSRHLNEIGISKGDRVAIIGENRPEWAISFFALSWIGAVAVPLDARASEDNHKLAISHSEAVAAITSKSFHDSIKSLSSSAPSLRTIIRMEELDNINNKYYKGIGSAVIAPDDLMQILFTSGTTGDPKGVMLTHKNLMSNVEEVHKIIEFSEDDTAFSILPIHHVYECTGGLLCTFYNGVRVFYSRSLKPREMLADLKTASPSIWLNSPLILEKLYQRISKELSSQTGVKSIIANMLPKNVIGKKVRQKLGLSNIKLILSGGAALSDWVGDGLCELGFPIIQGYGLSESAPLLSVNPASNPKNESVGMVIPGVELKIVDVDSEGNGEIWARGDNIMKGYYKNDSATKEVLTEDGWLKTGDIGYFDEDGYLYITGRKKYIIVTKGGKNVFPEEVEEKLCKSPFIKEAMVFSPDDSQIQALIFPNTEEIKQELDKSGTSYSAEICRDFIQKEIREINRNLEAYKKVSRFEIREEEFPKTTTRKIKRHLFKDYKI